MNKLKEFTKNIKEKWGGLTKGKKITFIIIPIGILCALIALIIYMNAKKYGVLFSNVNEKDSGIILNKLKEKKIEYKVEGKTIKVPREKVDTLRMEMASEVPLTNGSIGFEIFDNSKFGATDEEMKIKYQRALSGELERTIKGLPEIENAKVNLVMTDDSVFVRETTPASASLTIKLKPNKELKREQVKAIIALLCGSVKNLDKKNVEIIAATDDGTLLLTTPDLFNEDNKEYVDSTKNQEKIKKNVEKTLEEKIQYMLEKVYGKSNVVVKVNADLDFDSIQQNSTEFTPKGTVVSEHIITDNTNNKNINNNSPVDDNMTAREEKNSTGSNTSHKEEKRNYEISKNEKKIIKAPGSIKKISTSVLLNGEIDDATRTSITNLVIGAIGYDKKRQDSISVEAMNFDKSIQNKAKKDVQDMERMQQKEKLKKKIMLSTLGTIILIVLIIIFIIHSKKKKQLEYELHEKQQLDMVIGDNIKPKETFEPINFEEENEKTHIEKEIMNYANDKPDQVAEIVKSWLTEDER